MGFLDKVKDVATQAKGKATELADEKGPQIKQGIEKAGGFVNEKTKGKYADKVHKGTETAKGTVDKLASDGAKASDGPASDRPASDRPGSAPGRTTDPADPAGPAGGTAHGAESHGPTHHPHPGGTPDSTP
jgi:hypothetical protein